LYAEARKFFGAIALTPRITADFTRDVTGIDLPPYFLRNTSGGFTGRIVIITPRIIGFREEVNRPRTHDYPFSMFQMQFNKEGKGEGRMAYATQINFDKKNNTIELENYSSEPVRLNNLELEVRK